VTNRQDPRVKPYYERLFGQRPAEELYDLRADPDQLNNVAARPDYAAAKRELAGRLDRVMRETADPRLEDAFDRPPYVEANPGPADPRRPARKKK
jgi:N-sulfoglucosamine sulfohydrolase